MILCLFMLVCMLTFVLTSLLTAASLLIGYSITVLNSDFRYWSVSSDSGNRCNSLYGKSLWQILCALPLMS